MMKKASLLFLVCIIGLGLYPICGQNYSFKYKRKLNGISDSWHKIVLDNDMFIKSAADLRDLRILGITENKDTLEAPYILKIAVDETTKSEVSFKLINETVDANGKYYTFEIPDTEEINQVFLDFKKENFDWQIALEGSQNLNDWFNILQDYRILSIKNRVTDYSFTKLTFPAAKFKYFRLLVKEEKKPGLLKATLIKNELNPGEYRNYPLKSFKLSEGETNRQTILDFQLSHYAPVSMIELNIDKQFDFYRRVKVQCLIDSVKGPDKWNHIYQNVYVGVLSSLEDHKIILNQPKAASFKIIIDNQNNTPLTINSVKAQGNLYELTSRFLEPADYYLFYGDERLPAPDYDISYFRNKIPADLIVLNVGPEEPIPQHTKLDSQPLFANKIWLWGLMLVIIVVLGWFSFKMMKN